MAKLYFRYGAMGSSKTANAIMVQYNYRERGQKALMLKPKLDNRDGDRVVGSRSGLRAECAFVEELDEINISDYDCIIVDEAQFLTKEQVETLVSLADDHDIPVICYGLRSDFQMKGFPGSTRLLELAHSIEELKTICFCGKKAMINARLVNGEYVFEGAQVAIDGEASVEYRSLCPECYFKLKAEHEKKQK